MVRVLTFCVCLALAASSVCPDDPTVDLCGDDDEGKNSEASFAVRRAGGPVLASAVILFGSLAGNGGGVGGLIAPMLLSSLLLPGVSAGGSTSISMTCGNVKSMFKKAGCCGEPTKEVEFQMVPNPKKRISGANPCNGTKPAWKNFDCFKEETLMALEQAGAEVTLGVQGEMDVGDREPIKEPYHKTALCPVNVHWHFGAEHKSAGQFDENGKSPEKAKNPPLTGEKYRYGFACKHYDANQVEFTTEYEWKHCVDMHVGETYEVHWPHSALGACGTPNQYQTPFYDGVFCNFVSSGTDQALENMADENNTDGMHQAIAKTIGVQAQVFTIINDEDYYYPDLIRGMIVDGDFGKDITMYTGSTTGTTRHNTKCSKFAPITWHVDRNCHLISASSFDKMCADMKQMRDDMSGDLHAHGAREVVSKKLTADNQYDYQPPGR